MQQYRSCELEPGHGSKGSWVYIGVIGLREFHMHMGNTMILLASYFREYNTYVTYIHTIITRAVQ